MPPMLILPLGRHAGALAVRHGRCLSSETHDGIPAWVPASKSIELVKKSDKPFHDCSYTGTRQKIDLVSRSSDSGQEIESEYPFTISLMARYFPRLKIESGRRLRVVAAPGAWEFVLDEARVFRVLHPIRPDDDDRGLGIDAADAAAEVTAYFLTEPDDLGTDPPTHTLQIPCRRTLLEHSNA